MISSGVRLSMLFTWNQDATEDEVAEAIPSVDPGDSGGVPGGLTVSETRKAHDYDYDYDYDSINK